MEIDELTYEDFKIALSKLFENDHYKKYIYNFRELEIETVRRAFREKAKFFHPDRAVILGGDEKELEKQFKDLNDSCQILLNLINDKNSLSKLFYKSFQEYSVKKNDKRDFNLKKDDNDKNFFWKGAVPSRFLRLSEFLYYSKIIDRTVLVESLTWQFKNRPRIGEIAIENDLLTNNDVIEILKNAKASERFGETAVRLGLLTTNNVNLILFKQKNYNCPIGSFFVENSILSQHMLNHYIDKQKKHNQKYEGSAKQYG